MRDDACFVQIMFYIETNWKSDLNNKKNLQFFVRNDIGLAKDVFIHPCHFLGIFSFCLGNKIIDLDRSLPSGAGMVYSSYYDKL